MRVSPPVDGGHQLETGADTDADLLVSNSSYAGVAAREGCLARWRWSCG